MKLRNNIVIAAIITALFSTFSCKNEIDITDDWRETMVVFGLLNQADTAQYIKINKAFLGEEDAFVMAGIYDSSNYAQVDCVMERWRNNQLLSTHTLYRDSLIPKDPGVFSYPNQVLYKTTDPLFDDSEYKLKITNNESGNFVTSSCSLVKNFSILEPLPAQTVISFLNVVNPFRVKWTTGTNGRLYQLMIRFFFVRKDKITLIKTQDSVDWVFNEKRANSILGGDELSEEFMGELFYKFVKATIKNPGNADFLIPGKISNAFYQFDFFVYAAAEEFATYMEVNEPSLTVLQEKPIYTNIKDQSGNDAVGIFSSRLFRIKQGLRLTDQSTDSLFAGQYTYQLGFCTETILSPYFCQ